MAEGKRPLNDLSKIRIIRDVDDALSDNIVFALVYGDRVIARHAISQIDILKKHPSELYMPMVRQFSHELDMPPWELAKLLEKMAIREKELLTKRKFPQTSPPQPPRHKKRREKCWEFVLEKLLIALNKLKKARLPKARVIDREDK